METQCFSAETACGNRPDPLGGQGLEAPRCATPADSGLPSRHPFFTTKDLFWLIFLFPMRWIAALLPPPLFVRAGMLLAPFCRILTRGARRRIEERMRAAVLGLPEEGYGALSGRFVENSLRRALDDLVINRLAEKGDWRCEEVRGLANLERALHAGKGVVLVTGHFYANRLVKRYLASLGYPVLSIRNGDPPDPAAGVFGKRYLQPRYVRFLQGVIRDEVMLQDPELTLKVMKRLRAGGIVNVHLDAPYSVDLVPIPFLGSEWGFPVGFLRLAGACGAAIVSMLCRGNSGGFSVSFEPPPALEDLRAPGEMVRLNLSVLVGRLENQIRSHPDEWDIWFKL